MKQIRLLAQYYVDLMVKLGLIRFSLLLASALVVLAMIVQMAVTMVLHGHVESIETDSAKNRLTYLYGEILVDFYADRNLVVPRI